MTVGTFETADAYTLSENLGIRLSLGSRCQFFIEAFSGYTQMALLLLSRFSRVRLYATP